MLSDLDSILRAHEIEALIVPMHEAMHPSFRWLSRGAKLTKGFVVKKVGDEPLLIHFPMERDEAASAGLPTVSALDFGHERAHREESHAPRALARFFHNLIEAQSITGSVAFAGNLPFELYLETAEELERLGVRITRLGGLNPVQLARKRKDAREVGIIRSVGERTEMVVDRVREVLRGARVDGSHLIHDGRVLKLGDLKSLVSAEIVRLGMVEDHETILSQGRDAAIPHSRGDAAADVVPSVPIVLDIFPMDAATGYFFDTTRTFCVGEIPGELATIHGLVLEAFTIAADAVRAGTRASAYQHMVCDFFEKHGYATIRANPATTDGYVHGLGHGVGLDVHERPSFAIVPSNQDEVEVGDIITIEPGLYFPERGIGVRIEDTFHVDDSGRAVTLCHGNRGLEP
ncbi:MAG: M24 family metallopeptidase [Acidobacteria bacterium]|nr:M24 family metallopeptidase [Acidobacteriota bacterium]